MGRKLFALLALASVLTAACGGGDKKDQGSSDTTVPETTTTEPGKAGDPLTAASPGGSGQAGSGSPSSGASSSPTTVAPAAATTTTVRPTATTRTAAPGRYTYRRTGTRTVGNDQSLDGEGTLTVDRPNGNEQHSATSYTESSTEQTLRHRPGGIDLVFLKTTTSGVTYEFRPSQPVLFAPDPPTVGATWSWRMTSTDGSVTVDASFKVSRNETVTVGGEAVPTAVVEGDVRFSGALTGTSKQTFWGSDRYRLLVRTEETTDLGFAKSRSTSVLVSTKPA